ncbi:MAG: glycosyltransferase [Lachnospiraceae bacterium]|nr:glycosyltransferase [Lachnospiraceae bacterium]
MRNILVVINTLGRAGAETMLTDLLRRMPGDVRISLFVLTGQGEMVHKLPQNVHLLNRQYDDSSVLDSGGRRKLAKRVAWYSLHRGSVLKNAFYILDNLLDVVRHKGLKGIQWDKLLWRVLSDGAPFSGKQYDLAVAFLEGGSTYYVADHVRALRKVALIHVDYLRAGYTAKLDRDCYDRMDKIYAVSGEVKDSFLKVHPECWDKTEIFHNTPDGDRILKMSSEPLTFEALDKSLKLARRDDAKILVSVMRLTPQKSVDFCAYVCRRLLDDGVGIRWYVFGEGEERRKLEKLADRLDLGDSFVLCGSVDNPYPYMAACDLYVHLSRFEGKSLALQEALILGKRAVVTDTEGNREPIKDCKEIVPVRYDVTEAAKAIANELEP